MPRTKTPAICVGIDGCRGGYVAVVVGPRGYERAEFAERLDSLSCVSEATVVAIDMPLGLLEAEERLADQQARKELGRRGSSIFTTPVRSAVYAASYAEANALNRKAVDKGISKQAWNLVPKVRELAECADGRFYETHPELTFQTLKGAPLLYKKSAWGGLHERLRLLTKAGVRLPTSASKVKAIGDVGIDDVVDAVACAVVARDILAGTARRVPKESRQVDMHTKRPIAIYAPEL